MESASKVFSRNDLKARHQIEIAYSEELSPFEEESLFRKAVELFLSLLFEGDRAISIYFTNDKEIKELNQRFRDKAFATDILSWSYYEEDPDVLLIGDLVLSVEHVLKQAKENDWDFSTEVLRLLAHGCAHLAGWDHERSTVEAHQMLDLEKKLLAKVQCFDIYP